MSADEQGVSDEHALAFLKGEGVPLIQRASMAAHLAMRPDRIQGFAYATEFVVRDVWQRPEAQILWRMGKGEPNAESAFRLVCITERQRLGLQAALDLISSELAEQSFTPAKNNGDFVRRWFIHRLRALAGLHRVD